MIIKSTRNWSIIDLRELNEYRDLFYHLVIRDIKIRYKQTVLGALWVIIQPFFSMVVFTLFFGKFAKIPSDGVPYPIFSFSGMIVWIYFSNALSNSGNSLIRNSNLITKVYFPRLLIPLAPIISGLLDFFIAFIVLIMMAFYFNIYPTFSILFLPFLIIFLVITTSGIGIFFTALNIKYRDIGYAIPFLIQVWMFVSPIVYPVSMVPDKYRNIYALNPMVSIIEGFRAMFFRTNSLSKEMLFISILVSGFIFFIGNKYFRETESFFADII